MSIIDDIRRRLSSWLLINETLDMDYVQKLVKSQMSHEYYQGNQAQQIAIKPLQANDNIIINYTSLVVDRSLSLLLGDGVRFDVDGDDESPQQLYLDAVWDANRRDILLHRACLSASLVGTGYLKIVPRGDGQLPRLIALDSRWMSVETMPDDMDVVASYTMRYNVKEGQDTIAKKEVTRREGQTWMIEYWENRKSTSWQWSMVDAIPWPYPFPPIAHWQNLPALDVYGRSDVEDTLPLQDRANFVSGNISKIIRYHAHPKTWGRNINLGPTASWGGDEMITVHGDNGLIQNLEMQSDLASSERYLMDLRQSLFDISRTVDISSMADKLGALTNFGLRVLFMDAIAKRDTKRALFGEALEQTNGRLLALANIDQLPVANVWSDTLPRNKKDDIEALNGELAAGLVSKRTASGEMGRDWRQEMERMEEEQAAQENVGALAIRSFFNQGGA